MHCMRLIKILSSQAINRIAAGEVIERPIAIVKELVENAIDANATSIDIKFSKGGRNLVSVSDNGDGIRKEELVLAFCRHATSKLRDEKLENIDLLGFRGEALAAISAASKVVLTSRARNADCAWQIALNGSVPDLRDEMAPTVDRGLCPYQVLPAPHGQGTTIEVRDLFCFTPTRLKFLRSEQSENAACVDLVQRFALAFNGIKCSLIINNTRTLTYKSADNLERRVRDVLGDTFMENAVAVRYEEDNLKIVGYTSVPTTLPQMSGRSKQYYYVNDRIVKDPMFTTMIRLGYGDTLSKDRFPMTVLFVDIAPTLIDVNVHPNKMQIKFWHEQKVKTALLDAIRSSVGKSRVARSVDEYALSRMERGLVGFSSTSFGIKGERDVLESVIEKSYRFSHLEDNAYSKHFSNREAFLSRDDGKSHEYRQKSLPNIEQDAFDMKNIASLVTNLHNPEEIEDLDSGRPWLGKAVCQICETYIVAETRDGIVIVDQHAAHERLVLEGMKELSKSIPSQKLLIPDVLDLGAEDVLLLMSIHKALSLCGIGIEQYSRTEIMVREIPAILGGIDIGQLLADIAKDPEIVHIVVSNQINEIYAKIACYSSIRAGRRLNISEMNALLRMIEKNPIASQCNHGRPAYTRLLIKDINKIFER